MVSVKYSEFRFRILRHVDHGALCDVIMDTKASS